jgi:hypothetical protein
MSLAQYKGYRIETVFQGNWVARIHPPGNSPSLSQPVTATPEEGEQVLLGRAYAVVDEQKGK